MAVNQKELDLVHQARRDQAASALGLNPGRRVSKVTVVKSAAATRKDGDDVGYGQLSKAEQDLLRSMALTVEDNPWQRIQFTNKFNSLAPTYDPTALAIISYQNNTLRQCVAAMVANVDGTGYDIVRKDEGDIPKVVSPDSPPWEDPNPTPDPNDPTKTLDPDDNPDNLPPVSQTKPPVPPEPPKQQVPGPHGNPTDIPGNGPPGGPPNGQPPTPPKAKVEKPVVGKPYPTPPQPKPIMIDPPDVALIKAFWDEPYPGVSFKTMREKLRDDLETTGNAYLEVIRDGKGKIALLNPMDSKLTRLIRHDDLPVAVVQEVNRTGVPGEEQKITVLVHERRYVQIIGLNARFFKAYKATRQLNAQTGIWSNESAEQIEPQNVATEVIHFIKDRDVLTPYGIPVWINQLPSVMGSRKAEELNLEFFEHGGVPPVMVFIQGGTLSAYARKELTDYLAGAAKLKQRGVVLEVAPSGGDLNSASQVKVSTEKFGDAIGTDSKFEKYDDKCTQRVRGAWRLPPLLIGLAQDYNYATSQTAYMIAEEQVFSVERQKFDEIINSTLMKEIDPDGIYKYKSKPMTAKFLDEQIKALATPGIKATGESLVDAVNDIAGLKLVYDPNAVVAGPPGAMSPNQKGSEGKNMAGDGAGAGGAATGAGGGSGQSGGSSGFGAGNGVSKSEWPDRMNIGVTRTGRIKKLDHTLLVDLAQDIADHRTGARTFLKSHVDNMEALVAQFTPALKLLFEDNVAQRIAKATNEPDATRDLLTCAEAAVNTHAIPVRKSRSA